MQKFIQNIVDQLDTMQPVDLTPDTRFRDLDDWTSLTALSIIAMMDEEYGVLVTGDEFRQAQTIADLYALVNRS